MKTAFFLFAVIFICLVIVSCTQKNVKENSVRKAELFIPGCG